MPREDDLTAIGVQALRLDGGVKTLRYRVTLETPPMMVARYMEQLVTELAMCVAEIQDKAPGDILRDLTALLNSRQS
jgi:hypothetical protein